MAEGVELFGFLSAEGGEFGGLAGASGDAAGQKCNCEIDK